MAKPTIRSGETAKDKNRKGRYLRLGYVTNPEMIEFIQSYRAHLSQLSGVPVTVSQTISRLFLLAKETVERRRNL